MICEPVNPINDCDVKACTKCGETKPLGQFAIRKSTKLGHSSWCKSCINEYQKTLHSRTKITVSEKQCCACKIIKSAEDFYISNREVDGLTHRCKSCDQAYSEMKKSKEKIIIKTKTCIKCECEKGISEFHIDNTRLDGKRNICKSCQSQYDSTWAKENAGKAKAKNNKRRAQKLNATPSWLSEDHVIQIEFIYELATSLNGLHGHNYAVDHIHPLKGKNFSGLHVPWNLQILTNSDNAKKINNPPANEIDMFFPYRKSLGDCHGD